MRIDVSDAEAEQRVVLDELQDFPLRGDNGLGQIAQVTEDDIAQPQIAKGQLADHKRVRENASPLKQMGKRVILGAQMIDPDRCVDQVKWTPVPTVAAAVPSDQADCRRGVRGGGRLRVRSTP